MRLLFPLLLLVSGCAQAKSDRVPQSYCREQSFEGDQSIDRPWTLHRLADFHYARKTYPFDAGWSGSSGDLLRDLSEVCLRLARAGFKRCIVADLTAPRLQVPVVRVIVPGMTGPLRYGMRPSDRQLRQLV